MNGIVIICCIVALPTVLLFDRLVRWWDHRSNIDHGDWSHHWSVRRRHGR